MIKALYFRYILKLYLKNFGLVLLGVSLFYIIVDFATHFQKLSNSINLQILYIYYTFLYGIEFLYPLALLFGFLLTLNTLISRNELVPFFSSGFRRRDLLKPILGVGIIVVLAGWGVASSPLAYSLQKATSILEGRPTTNRNLFLKWKGKVVSIGKIEPILGNATDIKIFYLSPSSQIVKIASIKTARFTGREWEGKGTITLLGEKEWKSYTTYFHFLPNFRPKVVSNLKKLNSISFIDAYYALRYFKNLDINAIFSILFFKIWTPVLILEIILLLFLSAPIHRRLTNLPLFMIKSSLLGVLGWGVELLLFKFAKQGVVPFYLLGVPVGIITGVVIWKFLKKE